MQRRGESGQPVKGRRTLRPKARKVRTAHASIANLRGQLDRRTRERDDAFEQQTALSEILGVISSSPTDLAPVFNAILANATRLCKGNLAGLWLYDGEFLVGKAQYNASAAFVDKYMGIKIELGRAGPCRLAGLERRTVHVADITVEPGFSPKVLQYERARTVLAVPLLRDKELVGVIGIWRREVHPFTEQQIALVKTFANQAVIAIENARLLNELRQRTDDLSESLEQQTATADMLKIISSSPTDLAPVFEAILTNATRLCEGNLAALWRYDGKLLVGTAQYNASPGFVDRFIGAVLEPSREGPVRLVALERRTVHVADITVEPGFSPKVLQYERARTVLAVPLMRDTVLVGVISIWRREVRPFNNKQVELVQNFAAQAVIAIENARLFNSLEARTRELAASLEDLRNTQDRLVQTQKLASLGQLTAGIAHEMKNPLNFVTNFSTLSAELIDELQDTLKDLPFTDKARAQINEVTHTLRDNLDKVVHHGKRADAIVKNMLLHSRESSGEHRRVDINAIVEDSLNLAWHGARAEKQGFNLTIERSFDPAAGEADVFPQDITRALLNLISNGFYAATKRKVEAGSDGYEPTLTASTRSLGDRVEIRIRDNGAGIPSDVKEKIFDPFFTTKPAGEGTGLGLSISYDIIVKQHAGSIEVDTEPGKFTEICVTLPRGAAFVTASGKRS